MTHPDTEIAGTSLHRVHMGGCSGGSCQQGRARCETPTACGLPLDYEDDMSPTAKAIVQCFCIAVALVALCTVAANAIF